MLASESVALKVLGYKDIVDVLPGMYVSGFPFPLLEDWLSYSRLIFCAKNIP